MTTISKRNPGSGPYYHSALLTVDREFKPTLEVLHENANVSENEHPDVIALMQKSQELYGGDPDRFSVLVSYGDNIKKHMDPFGGSLPVAAFLIVTILVMESPE